MQIYPQNPVEPSPIAPAPGMLESLVNAQWSESPVAAITKEEPELQPNYAMRYQAVDGLGQPLADIAYKAVVAGNPPASQPLARGKTNQEGQTPVVSSTKDQQIELYFRWGQCRR